MMVLLLFFDVHRHVEQVFLGRPTQRQDGGGGLQTLAEAFKRWRRPSNAFLPRVKNL